MARRFAAIVFLCLCFCASLWVQSASAKKVALVIGIQSYSHLPKVEKASNDARAMADALKAIGIEVLPGIDPAREEMGRLLADFEESIEAGDTALLFFSGHGAAFGAPNYLLPSDMTRDGNILPALSYSGEDLVRRIATRGAKAAIFILDVGRDNPVEAVGRNGNPLSKSRWDIKAPERGLVLYSTGSQEKALDRLSQSDSDPNSVFTRRLLLLLQTKGLSHIEIVKRMAPIRAFSSAMMKTTCAALAMAPIGRQSSKFRG
jgi:Caspase domain